VLQQATSTLQPLTNCMFIVIIIFLLTLKFIFKKPFEKNNWRGKKKVCEIVVRFYFSFFGSCKILIFLAQGQSWMIFFWVWFVYL
jgi:hypothetical protein